MHDTSSVAPAAFIRYLPALQAVQKDEPPPEKEPFAHCKTYSVVNQETLLMHEDIHASAKHP
jgi:hypothetical protein